MKLQNTLTCLLLIVTQAVYAQKNKVKIFDKGSTLLDKKEYAKAAEAFGQVIAADSTEAGAYFNRGLAEMGLEQYEKALTDFQKFHSLEPDDPDGMNFISFMYYQMDDFENLIRSIKEFMPKASTEYNSNRYLGYAYYQLENYPEALSYLSYHLQLEQNDEWALITRAKTYVSIDSISAALLDLTRLIGINPKYHEALLLRAAIKGQQEDFWGSLEDIDRALAMDSLQAIAYEIKGEAYKGLKQLEKAKENFEKAIGLSKGENLGAMYQLGKLFAYDLSDPETAITYFDKILNSKANTEYEVYFDRAVAYTQLKQFEKAEADFKEFASLDTTSNNELNYYWADLKYRVGEYEKAKLLIKSYLTHSEELGENDIAAAYQLEAKLLIVDKKFQEAIALLDKSIKLNPNDGESHYWLGLALKNLHQKEKACEAFTKAYELQYDDAEAELKEICGYTGLDEEEFSDSIVSII